MKIVLDTNSLLVSISKKSKYRPIFDAIINGKIQLLISNEILTEYAEILAQKTTEVISFNITEFLAQATHVKKVEIYFRWHLIEKDVDDDKFVDCAVSGNADYIITDDKHFNALIKVKFPIVKVLKTEDFLKLISE